MSIKTLKSVVRRGMMFGAALAVVAGAFIPASESFADALNPLTDRSLTLSSSSPGWDYKDGSGNSTYAPPNSGANGNKTGNTFAFKVSSNTNTTDLKAMTFQYCTTSAGDCVGPGDITGHGSNASALPNKQSDLEIVTASPSELSTLSGYVDANSGTATTGNVTAIPAAAGTGNNFVVYYQTAGASTPTDKSDDTWAISSGWDMTTAVNQLAGSSTGKDNEITLTNATGAGFAAGTAVKVVFFATDTNYITNPGSGAFFVKINTWNDATARADSNIIDGGVTVANVMNQSIEIQTKVLETMDFSVGTVDPVTLSSGSGSQLETATGVTGRQHAVCDRILTSMNPTDPNSTVNTLKMGNQAGEFSLETGHTYATHSYWRLSSNSSAGATVYYSGNTLSNTVGDKIAAIGAVKSSPVPGAEQFGIALDNGPADGNGGDVSGTTGYKVNYDTEENSGKLYEYGADDTASGLVALQTDKTTAGHASSFTATGIDATMLSDPAGSNPSYHAPQLYPLVPTDNYNQGAGNVNTGYNGNGPANSFSTSVDSKFAFDETSQQIPVPIATEDAKVVDCVTGKMRYVANIAATTPAGIYTTKVNYIAAPQY